jgi:hypothetical protein
LCTGRMCRSMIDDLGIDVAMDDGIIGSSLGHCSINRCVAVLSWLALLMGLDVPMMIQ